jgi:hypothetical protein
MKSDSRKNVGGTDAPLASVRARPEITQSILFLAIRHGKKGKQSSDGIIL